MGGGDLSQSRSLFLDMFRCDHMVFHLFCSEKNTLSLQEGLYILCGKKVSFRKHKVMLSDTVAIESRYRVPKGMMESSKMETTKMEDKGCSLVC